VDGGGGAGGVTVSEPDLVAPPYAAEMVTVVDAATPLVLTVKVAVIAPLQPLRWNGTVAAVVLPLESIDLRAAWRVGPLSVTMPVVERPAYHAREALRGEAAWRE